MLRNAALVTCLALGCWTALAARASAQVFEFVGDACVPMLACERGMCAEGHPVIVSSGPTSSICVCADGPMDAAAGPLTLCCGSARGCAVVMDVGGMGMTGATCQTVPGLSLPGICVPTGGLPCLTDTTVTLEAVAACFTTPTFGGGPPVMSTSHFALGDCDGDGLANGLERPMGRSACCNEDADLDCCLAATPRDVAGCCAATSPEPAACCFANGSAMECCSAAGDLLACCAAAPDQVSCCHDAGGTPELCCGATTDALGCCLENAVPAPTCCGLYGGDDPRCATDGGNTPDSGDSRPDGAVGIDVGVRPDGGVAGMDGGAPEEDVGHDLGFGGGGGCRCAAHAATGPSPLAWLGIALALAIPSMRRRR